ncbi:PREDICTED: exonuclease 1 [Tarenaya hassleriana]|uniref:exonuclease 1 n=1 Tax=Tarenaya hassleriana TaxID=28532 RepID=UPI00053C4D59|nr:PREDICTED: exonuclease 1 [Tarenaya hassleriana]
MGIQGLLPLLKSIMVPINIKELEGCSVAVDTYSWLHKGALSCSRELCKNIPTSRHIEYCMHRVNLLRHHGVRPVLVFDGGFLPMKLEQENKRARSRKENLARAIEHEANGNSKAAYECYQKAVDISPFIAHELIQVLKRENVDYVVAPYEADAQMTFLAVTKQVDAVITEDSDLIPFGCPRIIFKMDKFGQAVEFRASMLHRNKDLSFSGFSNQMLLEMCILSGCDYLQSLPGMGLKRAHALITRFKSYDRVIKHLKYNTGSVPPLYEESFRKAILTFKHQRVYDPKIEDIAHLSVMSESLVEDSEFLGPMLPQYIAKGIAQGILDPFTQMPFQIENVAPQLVVNNIGHPKTLRPESVKKKLDLPVQKNLLTKYFCFASLEAKRKFRAPRMSSTSASPTDDSSSTPEENTTVVEASLSEESDLLASPSFVHRSDNASQDENGSGREVAEESGSENNVHGDGMVGNHQESGHHNIKEQVERLKTEGVKVIVRSKYFVHKQRGKHLSDCSMIDRQMDFKTQINEQRASRGEERPTDIRTSPHLHRKRVFEDHHNWKDGVLFATNRALTDSNVQRRNHQNDKNENRSVLETLSDLDTPENATPLSTIPGNTGSEATTGKRKTLTDDNLHKENFNPKHLRADETSPGCREDGNGETLFESRDETKFGSNISHLGHYSEIAEKSVGKIVSAISSFRYSGSGSRASGLRRAPLRDVQNTFSEHKRSSRNPKPDLSQFAYVPSNRNTRGRSRS